MTLKLLTEADVLDLPPLPFEVGVDETHRYFAMPDEIIEATHDKIEWLACWFNGRLYKARSMRLWETMKR